MRSSISLQVIQDALSVSGAIADALERGVKMPGPDEVPVCVLERGFDRTYAKDVIDALRSMAIKELLKERLAWCLHVGRAQEVYAIAVKTAFEASLHAAAA